MPRSLFSDPLLIHQFHLIDVDFSLSVPPFVLWPTMGFTSITSPEISIAVEDITEGSSDYIHHVLGKVSTNTITLQRAETAFNSDFWRWIIACTKGKHPLSPLDVAKSGLLSSIPIPGKRRNLLLIHMSGVSAQGALEIMLNPGTSGLDRARAVAAFGSGGAGISALSQSAAEGGLMDLGITSIPAKVFMLFDCLPTRYKPSGDFDATASTVSLEELDLSYHHFEEFSLSA